VLACLPTSWVHRSVDKWIVIKLQGTHICRIPHFVSQNSRCGRALSVQASGGLEWWVFTVQETVVWEKDAILPIMLVSVFGCRQIRGNQDAKRSLQCFVSCSERHRYCIFLASHRSSNRMIDLNHIEGFKSPSSRDKIRRKIFIKLGAQQDDKIRH